MPITITTTSSLNEDFNLDRNNAIYPVFVDNTPYTSFIGPTVMPASYLQYFPLKATGGSTYVWSLISGALPDGLTLASDGKISGTPIKEGNFTFTVQCVSGSDTAQKTLSVTAHPFRAKWHEDAKYAAFLTMGSVQYPTIFKPSELPQVDARITNFNATSWVTQLKNLGFGLLNYSGYSTDSVRMWPSTSTWPGIRQMKTSRDYLGELITACHAQGMKIAEYFPADTIRNDPTYQNTDPDAVDLDGNSTYTTDATKVGQFIPGRSGRNADPPSKADWGARNTALIEEIVKKGVDMIWFDVGATNPALYNPGAVEADFFRRNTVIPIMRWWNPFMLIGINGGINSTRDALGNQWLYPHIDVNIYEGTAGESFQATTLVNGFPNITPKRMSIESLNLLDKNYTWNPPINVPGQTKDIDVMIDSIQKNWKKGATYMLNWATGVDGTLVPPQYTDALNKLAAYVKPRMGVSEKPYLRLDGNVVTISTNTSTRIFYTLDGSKPDESSMVYTQPITLTRTTTVKAITKNKLGKWSSVETIQYNSTLNNSPSSVIRAIVPPFSGDTLATEANAQYRGMSFIVGNDDIELYQIGRKGTATTDKSFVIRKAVTMEPVLSGIFRANSAVNADGFQYCDIPKVKLDAGGWYVVGIQEGGTDQYPANPITSLPQSRHIRILGPSILNSLADPKPIVNDNNGQFINFKFIPYPNKSRNLALGIVTKFKSNISPYNEIGPNAVIYYAANEMNEYEYTYGSPGGIYQALREEDLMSIKKVKKVVVNFFNNNLVEMKLSHGRTVNTFNPIATVSNNYNKRIVFDFEPIKTRYLYLQTIKPDGPNQPGNGALIQTIEIY